MLPYNVFKTVNTEKLCLDMVLLLLFYSIFVLNMLNETFTTNYSDVLLSKSFKELFTAFSLSLPTWGKEYKPMFRLPVLTWVSYWSVNTSSQSYPVNHGNVQKCKLQYYLCSFCSMQCIYCWNMHIFVCIEYPDGQIMQHTGIVHCAESSTWPATAMQGWSLKPSWLL